MSMLNETHDPQLQSWVPSANTTDSDFPIQNLPFAVFRRKGTQEAFRGGVAIGDRIVDLGVAAGCFDGLAAQAAKAGAGSSLNVLMALGQPAWSALRLALSRALREGAPQRAALVDTLVAQSDAEYGVPARIGDYTDFYTSIHHATNIGRLFRPDNPLMPNYKWVPIGYHGRASSIGVSGQTFARPVGQTCPPGADTPSVGPSRRLDYELELAVYIGTGNDLGTPIPIDVAESHVFGISLLNDWSARDIQAWEYQPLGPFLSKNFATTVSPWIVMLEALAPYRVPFVRPQGDPQPLAYLDSAQQRERGGFDIELELGIETAKMRAAGQTASRVSRTNYRHAYWTVAQMVAHHTVNGCNLQPGDLFGTGTLSGPTLDQAGALIETTSGGKHPFALANGETRTFLEDGDAVVIRGWCEKPGVARIGFGECRGSIVPAREAA
ncbi:fumarylacetoacetase [Trinickia caryophylli]|uniref:fumarylacetoacetase n=1 Tax=Trinickia caryophylli TaxID=28094 RepID=A0A1X7HB56_TRICW|nr:fumarylacetoacetase [Trinickia caryophylli]PMS08958.1 fumarylacetoacetase [Trinickia caryophylli]TRX17510.1 fumarylacetoacetase [Trinickia caryophylli]WQE11742.1 fumarylacetoacetase [Trinickia caryophylli]SMF82421.1 fumarylacetoacetate hydrolase [Trinickia caryophylli]GLU35822.1 fumarylacetoacetase [Trinickia caryophylli]